MVTTLAVRFRLVAGSTLPLAGAVSVTPGNAVSAAESRLPICAPVSALLKSATSSSPPLKWRVEKPESLPMAAELSKSAFA